jgi:hypothetical protein
MYVCMHACMDIAHMRWLQIQHDEEQNNREFGGAHTLIYRSVRSNGPTTFKCWHTFMYVLVETCRCREREEEDGRREEDCGCAEGGLIVKAGLNCVSVVVLRTWWRQ